MNEQHFNTVIKPKSGWFDLHLKEVFAYRDLIFLFVKRNFVSKYKQTVLGPAWAIIQPLLTTVVFTLVFGNIAGLAPDGVPSFVFYLSGTVLWTYFSNCLTQTANTFVANSATMGKVYFPRLVMPISTVFSELISLAIQYVFLIIFLVYYAAAKQGVQPNLWMLMTPPYRAAIGNAQPRLRYHYFRAHNEVPRPCDACRVRHAALDVRFPDCIRHVPFYRFCPRREVACAVYVQPNLADCKSVPLCISRNGRNRMEVLFHRLGDNSCPALHRHCAVQQGGKDFYGYRLRKEKMDEIAIRIEHVSKEYRLGAIGGGTLRGDLQSLMARIKGREDPNSKIGSDSSKRMGERFLALDDVSFEVKKGEALGIIGHNGAGKSTLLKLLSRVTAPTKGTISYNGRIASMLEVGTGFHPELTGRENVYMNGAILGMTKAEIDRKFDQIVEFAEMEKFIDTPVKRYSSGMYVKLAFAVAAHLDSEIMVMDEVLAVGDMKFQKKCLGKMGDAANTEGRTVLYVSHNMNTIRQLCTRCIVLDHGKLIFDGDVEKAIEIYEEAKSDNTPYVDYSAYERPHWLSTDSVRIQAAEYCNYKGERHADCNFKSNNLIIRITIKRKRSLQDVGFRMEIKTLTGTIVGTTILKNLPIDNDLELQCLILKIDIGSLLPGEYSSNFVLFSKNEFGTCQNLDWVAGLGFKKIAAEKPDIDWDYAHWGSIQLNSPEILHL